jgi:hypothetical protein
VQPKLGKRFWSSFFPAPAGRRSLPVDLVEDLEDFDEEAEEVQVEVDRGHDVLLRREPMHDRESGLDDET